jgi:hypothetical protein
VVVGRVFALAALLIENSLFCAPGRARRCTWRLWFADAAEMVAKGGKQNSSSRPLRSGKMASVWIFQSSKSLRHGPLGNCVDVVLRNSLLVEIRVVVQSVVELVARTLFGACD